MVRQLCQQQWPNHVRIADFGIRSTDLTFALLDNFDLVILVDALQRGYQPGRVTLIEPDFARDDTKMVHPVHGHGMDVVGVLRSAATIARGNLPKVLLIGCEPARVEYLEGAASGDRAWINLSDPVRVAVQNASQLVESLVLAFDEQPRQFHE